MISKNIDPEVQLSQKKVLITRAIPDAAMDLLKQHFDVEISPFDRALTREELLERVQGKDGVLCILNDRIDGELMDAAGPQNKIFANYAVGYNNIDVSAATERGIVITNTPGVLDDATADMAWALLFAAARRVIEADTFTRAGKFDGWAPMMYLGRDITGKTLGVVGTGRIGANFARKAAAFDMDVLYADEQPNPDLESAIGAKRVDLHTLLEQSDFVSLHVPLLPSTRHLIGEKELKIMKRTAVLINTSRGPVVDEAALVRALKSGEIWSAGLDVFEEEPKLHPELPKLDNVVIAPHIASSTFDTRTNMGLIAARNIINVLNGKKPETPVTA